MHRVLAAHASHAKPIVRMHTDRTALSLSDAERLEQQRIAIAGILKQSKLAGHTIVEVGAGDGSLSRTLWHAGAATSFILLDKSRRRMERASNDASLDGFAPCQLCVDVDVLKPEELRHAVLARSNALDCVLLSNHMCGAALDTAIDKALRAWPQPAAGNALAGIVAVTYAAHTPTPLIILRMLLADPCVVPDCIHSFVSSSPPTP